eukprot:40062_1
MVDRPQQLRRKSKSLPKESSIAELQALLNDEDGPQFVKDLGREGSIQYSTFRVPAYRITQAVVYIQDAMNVRMPQKRITQKSHILCFTPISAYQFCHSKLWKLFTFLVIWVYLLSVWITIEPSITHIPWSVFLLELLCLLLLSMDCMIRLYSHDTEFRHSSWTKVLLFVLTVDYFRLTLMATCFSRLGSLIILLQCFRPYYLINNARSLRTVVKAVLRSLPKIFDFVWIIATVVVIFGIVGYELFHEINPTFFGSKQQALFSLFVTLTTANFPDVMMEGYAYSPYTVIFFALYVIIIIVILCPTILAVIYAAYHTQTALQFSTIQKIQLEALHQAFDVLTYHLRPVQRRLTQRGDELTIGFRCWVDLLKHLRPDLSLQHAQVLYTTLKLDAQLILKPPSEAEHILSNRKPGLALHEWFKLPEFLEVKFQIAPTATIAHRLITLQTTLDDAMDLYSHQRTFWNRCKSSIYKFRIFMLFIFTSPVCDNIIDWIVWLNTMVILSLNWYYVNDIEHWFTISYMLDVISCVFVAEMGLKIYAYGGKAFFHHTFLVCDLLLVVLTLCNAVFVAPAADRDNYVTLLRGVRLLRIMRQFPRMRLILRFFGSLSRAFAILLLVQFCLFYQFAMIGIVLFGGKVSKETVTAQYEAAVDARDMDMQSYWMGVIDTYYYLNNMNDFFHSMVTLMELAVVNNWQVISGTFIAITDNDYYRVYFIVFYFFAVIVLLNIIIAFILDIFITQYSKNFSENSLLYRYKKYVMMSIMIHELHNTDEDFDLLHWHIQRPMRPALLMQTLFEDAEQDTQAASDSMPHGNLTKSSSFKATKLAQQMSGYSRFKSVGSQLHNVSSTVSLKAHPTSSLSLLKPPYGSHDRMHSDASKALSALSKEEAINRTQNINYDALEQMPWGQESLAQDFLHLYNSDNYYKRKHKLVNQNFADAATPHSRGSSLNPFHLVYSQYLSQDPEMAETKENEMDPMRRAESLWHIDEQTFAHNRGNFEPITPLLV